MSRDKKTQKNKNGVFLKFKSEVAATFTFKFLGFEIKQGIFVFLGDELVTEIDDVVWLNNSHYWIAEKIKEDKPEAIYKF